MARVATAARGTRMTEAERSSKESARFVVAMRAGNSVGAKGPCESGCDSKRGRMGAVRLATPENIRNLQRALYRRAKQSPTQRFYSLYDKVYRRDVLDHSFALCRANDGAAGPDGMTFSSMDETAVEAILTKVTEQLQKKTYRPGPVRRVYIPKANGGERPLGIPTSSTAWCRWRPS